MTTTSHAIISGGSSGIGFALADRLASQGWNLSILARDEARLQTARERLVERHRKPGQEVHTFVADVTDAEHTAAATREAISTLGPPDLLVANAGMVHPGLFVDLPPKVFRQTMATNYFGALHLLKAALPAMCERENGHVVLVSSGAGLIGVHGYAAYAPSKFALRGLAESLRSELKQHGIGISVVYPPDTDTPQLAAEEHLKPPATKRITANARVLSADAVAEAIIAGVRARRFTIAPGLEMKLLAPLHSLIGPLLQRYFDHLVAKTTDRIS